MNSVIFAVFIIGILTVAEGQFRRPDNLAYWHPTKQSSGTTSDLAVDGDRTKLLDRLSCAKTAGPQDGVVFWYVDLLAEYTITRVVFGNSAEDPSLAKNFKILVAKELRSSLALSEFSTCAEQGNQALEPSKVQSYTCFEVSVGRYVVVLKPGKDDISICELEVYDENSFGNWALGQPVTTYSQYQGSYNLQSTGILSGNRATDGQTDNNHLDKSCVHSSNGGSVTEEWISVDLGEEMRIRRVRFMNRGDGYGNYFTKFRVLVTSDFHPWYFEKNQFLECYHQMDSLSEAEIVQVNCDYVMVGRYVLVLKYDAQSLALMLCELEIEATRLETNLALEKPTLMSGELNVRERLSYRGVDGSVSGRAAAMTCIQTPGTSQQEFWMVDLLETYRVRNVIIAAPGEENSCLKPMGMSVKRQIIRDDQLSVSSTMKLSSYIWSKEYARFFNPAGRPIKDGWCHNGQPNQWIQISFDADVIVSGILVQGAYKSKWIQALKVSTSMDGANFEFIKKPSSNDPIEFTGTFAGQLYTRTAWFPEEIRLKYIRIFPTKWKFRPCIRFEVLGCYKLGKRLENFKVLVGKKFDPTNYASNQLSLCYEQKKAMPANTYKPLYCKSEVVGRYVVVEKNDALNNPLNFCELEVYGIKHSGNLAFGADTKQSDTITGKDSKLSVDGNRNSNFLTSRSCSQTSSSIIEHGYNWWYIDMVERVDVGKVVIVTNKDCCDKCLSRFKIFVTDSIDEANPARGIICVDYNRPGKGAEGLTINCEENTFGRYVVLVTDRKKPIAMCEFEAYERFKFGNNIALGKPAIQSTDAYADKAHAYAAVDGVRKGDFRYGSCSMTCGTTQEAWLAIDLLDNYHVRKVVLVNREDCCAERMNSIAIVVAKGFIPFGLNQVETALCYSQTAPLRPAEVKTIYCKGQPVGTHLVLSKTNAYQEPLTVCEVEVYGKPYEESMCNLKSTNQSSNTKSDTSWKVVDGNFSPEFYDGSCSITSGKWSEEWWTVDMKKPVLVERVIITNRGDCCSDGLRDYAVLVGNVQFSEDPKVLKPASNVCEDRRTPELAGGDIIYITCSPGAVGRYLTVYKEQTSEDSPLVLCEVEAFGKNSYTAETDIAIGKVVSSSDVATRGNMLTKGVEETQEAECAEMTLTNEGWINVDLQEMYDLTMIKVLLPGDCCDTYTQNLEVVVSKTFSTIDIEDWIDTGNVTNYKSCGKFEARAFKGQYVNFPCYGTGQYISVVGNSTGDFTTMKLCAIQAYGIVSGTV